MRFASCMAPNAEPLFQETVDYLADRLGINAIIAHDRTWEQREHELDHGQIEVGWICGLPYVWKADQPNPALELLAAPVMSAERYGDRPVYFSDVMVRTDSPFRAFSDLDGARWAYNEPRSHSGYGVVKAHLFDLGELDGYFGSVHMAGSHEIALEMIISGSVDGAAIDTTVFETALRDDPVLGRELRVIETLGPSPMPPWVISTKVEQELRDRLRHELAHMQHDPEGADVLHHHMVTRYEVLDDAFYDPIRTMDRKARQVRFGDETE
jgi:phosphonate transport system substrate-binding protein